jgi:predicted Holliday junction resolvase-like endonuclease
MHLISEYIEQFITGIIVMLIGGITWLFRTVFTNQKEIALLKEDILFREEKLNEEIKNRERMRAEDREILLSMKVELKEDSKEMKQKVENLQVQISELWKNK